MSNHVPGRNRSALALLASVALAMSALTTALPTSSVSAASGTVTGKVFVDGGADGQMNGSDVGVGGVLVRAFDSTGAEVGTATTSPNGTYSLNVSNAATNALRIEFPTPAGYQSTLVSGTGAGSSIQFVETGATNVNYAFYSPGDYCQATMSLASVCINQGSNLVRTTERVVGVSSFEPASQGSPRVAVDQSLTAVTTISTRGGTNGVGATWGLGWQKNNRLLWNSAVIRRHSALGPQGIGGVYVHNLNGTQVASFDLTSLGLVLKGASDDYSDAARDIVSATEAGRTYDFLSRDKIGYEGVGMAGLGDIDVSQDSNYLWVTNLYERKIHRIAISGTASAPTLGAVQTWTVSNGHTCANNTGPLRPWGLDTNEDGSIVVAAVCTNEAADPTAKPLPGVGVILKLDPSKPNDATAWNSLAAIDFSYAHKYDYCSTATSFTCTWKAWTNNWVALQTVAKKGGQYWWTQPMIVDLEQLADGSFTLGINDRLSYQLGSANYEPVANGTSSGFVTGWTAGDTLLICKTATGWQQEVNGGCSGQNTYTNSRGSTDEFFYDSFGHPETTIGGLALGRSQVAVAAMDPASYFLSGVRWVSAVNGQQTNALNMNPISTSSDNPAFGKSSGMGDLEALCDDAPLQIGNRVWYDYDHDGIQDADEDPVVGVTVRLYNSSQTLVGTAITNANGEYYFTSTNTEAANGGATPDEFGGGLAVNTAYTVVLDNPDDCLAGRPLDGWILTLNDQTTTEGPPERDNLIDSDAVALGLDWCNDKAATVQVAPMSVGDVNHSYDIGFWKEGGRPAVVPTPTETPSVTPSQSEVNVASQSPTTAQQGVVSVGNFVWRDHNGDGRQGRIDRGLAGAVLRVYDSAGKPAVDINGNLVRPQRTKSDGKYLFTNLPPGQYTVTIRYPRGWVPTLANKPNRAKNSSTKRETSRVLPAGQSDLTLDFGVVTVKSWFLPASR